MNDKIKILSSALAILTMLALAGCQSSVPLGKSTTDAYLNSLSDSKPESEAQAIQQQQTIIEQPPTPIQIQDVSAETTQKTTQTIPQTQSAQEATQEDIIKIPLSEISANAKFFSEDIDGVTMKYFAVKASDGTIKTAFDACDVCYKAKKGYRQEGDEMVCNNCGRHYRISSLGVANFGTGCWPSYLKSRIEGDYLIISRGDLAEKRYMFD